MTGHPTWTQDNVVSLALIGSVAGQSIVNVLHFQQVSGTQDPAGAAAFCDELNADWNTNCLASWKPIHANTYFLTTLRATPVAVSGLAHVSLASHELAVTGGGGSGGTPTESLSAAAELKLRTLEGGKSHRGRIYVGPVPTGVIVSGQITSGTYLTAEDAFITATGRYMAGGAFVATGRLVVFSRPLHAAEQQWTVRVGGTLTVKSNPAARAGDATPVSAIIKDVVVRSQRRREVGVGA